MFVAITSVIAKVPRPMIRLDSGFSLEESELTNKIKICIIIVVFWQQPICFVHLPVLLYDGI